MIRFVVPGVAVGKGRPRARIVKPKFGGEGFVQMYTPRETVVYEEKVAVYARRAMGFDPPMQGPLSLSIEVHMPIPASWTKGKKADAAAQRAFPTGKPDVDNYAKAAADAMNAIVYEDDSQIVELYARKVYSDRPRMIVAVSAYE